MSLKRKTGAFVVLLVVIAAAALFFSRNSVSPTHFPVTRPAILHVGDLLPKSFQLVTLTGDALASKTSENKVLLINFWAGWCGPCLHEMPSLYKLYEKYKD